MCVSSSSVGDDRVLKSDRIMFKHRRWVGSIDIRLHIVYSTRCSIILGNSIVRIVVVNFRKSSNKNKDGRLIVSDSLGYRTHVLVTGGGGEGVTRVRETSERKFATRPGSCRVVAAATITTTTSRLPMVY